MSSTMRIRLASDMPPTALEVLSPEHDSVKRLALSPGREATVEIPSERSFVRVYLPSGRYTTLATRSDLNYEISRAVLESEASGRRATPAPSSSSRSVNAIKLYQQTRNADTRSSSTRDSAQVMLGRGVRVVWSQPIYGQISSDGNEVSYRPDQSRSPYHLTILSDAIRLELKLPGMLRSVYVRADELDEERGSMVSVRLASKHAHADTVGSYLARADYYSAESMASWVDEAHDMLQGKLEQPFAATIAGYLLLRLERYDHMRDWAKNLANWFKDMSDGSVIWALQSLRQRNDVREATEYLLRAARMGWPVYTEGTRLLSNALRRMGDEGMAALQALDSDNSRILWSSPVTARVIGSSLSPSEQVSFDIGYDALA